ncbi:hypothetical protein TREPR_0861 [Treponema primitia ZAS-2]|uniref:Zinc ribbon domain-containing protein n=1 Tax=Treponema primitia (strain ATCC BAA-887 / DSM 12427 / ZAS-2) TaxID=545694 RepID=F5YIN5_TREPZ|nr:hypothetical protein [Treponema primitia]AEF85196.1 hypothetical protein TREPR_0861 [Treponema primitia ZAS-2]
MFKQIQIISPIQGMTILYRCRDCNHGFMGKVPLLGIFSELLGKKCPHCGSRNIERDSRVRY